MGRREINGLCYHLTGYLWSPATFASFSHAFVDSYFSGRSATITEEWIVNTEQRLNLKFFVWLKKTASKAIEILQQVNEDSTIFLSWYKSFKEGREVEWNMILRAAGLQQTGRRSTSSGWERSCVVIICWLYEWSQVNWTRKRTVSGRLSPKIWTCLKSNRVGFAEYPTVPDQTSIHLILIHVTFSLAQDDHQRGLVFIAWTAVKAELRGIPEKSFKQIHRSVSERIGREN